MNNIITTQSLTKEYDHKKVVNALDLIVPEGSVYGFLGPNGAGKSTTLKMLLGLVKPTDGQVRISGKILSPENRLEILRQTGSLIESPAYYGHLSGRENLQIICKLKNVSENEISRVMHLVRMEKQMNKKVRNYSLGMKQRLGIAAALLGSPKLLLLDEPSASIDPYTTGEMEKLLKKQNREKKMTMILVTHNLAQAKRLADYVVLLNRGNVVESGDADRFFNHPSQPETEKFIRGELVV